MANERTHTDIQRIRDALERMTPASELRYDCGADCCAWEAEREADEALNALGRLESRVGKLEAELSSLVRRIRRKDEEVVQYRDIVDNLAERLPVPGGQIGHMPPETE